VTSREIAPEGGEFGAPGPYVFMTDARRTTGQIAEDLVAERLAAEGWEIIKRNARTRYGELDIVAREGRVLVFIEVKGARLETIFGPEKPILSIDFRKQRKVRRLGTAWMAEREDFPRFSDIRFDAVGVTLDRADRAIEIDHVKGAF
jgi:putative endonuclease